jgi:acetylornithine deacetylase/succinyl-diaminopimelate desuccinylase family protein
MKGATIEKRNHKRLMDYEKVKEVLDCIDDQEVIKFTQDFIRINSVNPNLEPGSSENEVVEFLAEYCLEAGLQVTKEELAPDRPNLYCVLPGEDDEIGLALLGHTDTVPFLGMKDPLSAEIEAGYMWGRGGVDMKAGVAASIQAMIALARSGLQLRKGVACWAVIDEESEHRGAYALEQGDFKADYCICTEPSNMELLLGCKGTAPIRVDFTGVLAHGSNPWLGVNAVEMASKFVLALKELVPKKIEIPELGMEIQGSVNVGVIEGGTQYNNVADTCSVFLDRRMAPGETQATVLDEIQGLLDELASQDEQFEAHAVTSRPDWHWEPIIERGLNPAYTPPDNLIVKTVQQAHHFLFGNDMPLGYTHGYMDMDFTVNGLGIPTINFGPGETKYAHTVDEKLRVSDLLAATRIYALTGLQLGL